MDKCKTERVDFNSPKELLRQFDEAIEKMLFPNRTDAFLALMRNLVKYRDVERAGKEA